MTMMMINCSDDDDVKLKSDSGAYEPIQVPQCGEMSNKSWELEFEILIQTYTEHFKYHFWANKDSKT